MRKGVTTLDLGGVKSYLSRAKLETIAYSSRFESAIPFKQIYKWNNLKICLSSIVRATIKISTALGFRLLITIIFKSRFK